MLRRLEVGIGAAVAVVACAVAAGPGWLAAAEHGTAARLGILVPWAPGYGAIAELAARLPIGEVGFRVALVSAVAAGILAAGVVAMVRALVAREVGAAIGAVAALALVTAVEVAATTPGPAMMIAAGVAWTVAGVIAMRRADAKTEAGAATAIVGLAIALAAAPYIGLALALIAAPLVWRRRRVLVLIPVLVLAPLVIVAGIPPLAIAPFGRIADIAGALGSDAGVIVLGAGALGLGFGAATGLRGTGLALVAIAVVVIGGAATPIAPADVAVAILPVLALGIAVLATAGIRAAASTLDGARRSAIAAALAMVFPLLALTLAAGRPEPDADAPARAAADLAVAAPAGPGAIFAGGDALMTALRYERAVAGLRPDLVLRPRAPDADAVAIGYLRAGQVVAADVPAFGRLDDHYARPLGRGFQLLLETAAPDATPDPPATYPGAIGRAVAARLALARGLWEAGGGALDHAARAGGFAGTRFDAGAIALFAAVEPSPQRPALFGFVPAIGAPTDHDWLDLLGDDLAWVGGILEPPLPDSAPAIRKLHARWRAVLAGISPPADPAIRALGHAAVVATREMLTATGHADAAAKLAP